MNHFNSVLPSAPRSSKWSASFTLPAKILYAFLICPYMLHALIIINVVKLVTFVEEYKLWSYWLCNWVVHSRVKTFLKLSIVIPKKTEYTAWGFLFFWGGGGVWENIRTISRIRLINASLLRDPTTHHFLANSDQQECCTVALSYSLFQWKL